MYSTRFMQVMFSAMEENDEELTNQVADDIEAAKSSDSGVVDTDEVTYVNLGSGKVLVTDKGTGEATVVEQDPEDAESYSLEGIENDEELERYLHTLDGITPDDSVHTEEHENFLDHMTGEDVISPNLPNGGLNPQAGYEPSICGEGECEDKEFSVSSDNEAVIRIFSDTDFYDRIFSEVISEDKPAVIGDLKIEKCEDCPDSVIVTDLNSGDEAKVTLDDEDMVVSEVQKEFEGEKKYSVTMTEDELYAFNEYLYSDLEDEEDELEDGEQYEPLYVVGLAPEEHVLVDSPVYSEEDAQILAQRLSEDGVEGVNIFDDPDEAREYAISLLGEAGVSEMEQIAEPEEKEFSDCTLYLTRYFSDYDEEDDRTNYMYRLFSEAEEGRSDSQDDIEDAIESGEQIENNHEIITPVDATTAVVEDKESGEFTKVTINGEDLDTEKISEEEADELTEDLETSDEDDDDEEEKEYSDTSDYQIKLFSNDEVKDDIEDAIESGEQIENSSEVITPVDATTAVVEDKTSGEFTKVTIDGENFDTEKISEEEADELTDDLETSDEDDDEEDDNEEEKEYSDYEDNEYSPLLKFFAEMVDPNAQAQMAAAAQQDPNAAALAQQTVDPNMIDPNTGNPVVQQPGMEGQVEGVESIEDKALAAVQSIQEAANDAVIAIQQAKEAPAPGAEQDLQEAQFSETDDYYDYDGGDTLSNWLYNK